MFAIFYLFNNRWGINDDKPFDLGIDPFVIGVVL